MHTETRRRLPVDREGFIRHFQLGKIEGYVIANKFEDGTLGELFIKCQPGSPLYGLMDGFAIMVSLARQYGVPLKVILSKLRHISFEPSGFTGDAEIPSASSVLDYIAHWLELKFLPGSLIADNSNEARKAREG